MSAVVLSPYSNYWPQNFERIRAEVLGVFDDAAVDDEPVNLQHIGSTSVPGLCAKPVIDVLLGAASLAQIEAKIAALDALGYGYVAKYERELPMRRYFVRDAEGERLRVHLHGVVLGSPIWREHLAFRDALRIDPALRDRYAALKTELVQRHAGDKAAYTDAKAPFIRAIMDAALAATPATP
ncbi:MAG: GrpB family protein [Xanthomonadaceae bacterium]|nr:GrpB family protein [Xanthomonadaceae bacterium]